jgi:hypothetical protein
MKFSISIFVAIIVLVFTSVTIPKQTSAQEVSVSFQTFYDNLSPYGQWIDRPGFGYVWVPQVGSDFVPYSTGGYWAWSDYGWTWVSDYNWGWAPFHYGRWDYDNNYGWFWLPDNEWGPAWVSWRRSPGYYGWAPLGPNISVDISFGNSYVIPNDHWIFVNEQYLGRQNINTYYGPRKNNSTYIHNSTVINNTYIDKSRNTTYMAGPKREDVQRTTGAPVRQISFKENSKPGQSLKNNEFNIYRPSIVKREDSKPTKVADTRDVKPVSTKTVATQPSRNNAPAEKQTTNKPKSNPVNPRTTQRAEQPKQAAPQDKNTVIQSQERKQQHNPPLEIKPNSPPKIEQPKSQTAPAVNVHSQQVRTTPPAIPKEQSHQQAPAPQREQPSAKPQRPAQEEHRPR